MNFPEESFRKPVIQTAGGRAVPVGTVFCIGRNYQKHIKELNSKDLGEPVIFTKPSTAVFQGSGSIVLPSQSGEVHHEVELAIIIGKRGKDFSREESGEYIAGAAVALDLTMRDLQSKAKKNGTPWAIAKGFDHSCPISNVYPERGIDGLSSVELVLEKNGEVVQRGNTGDMIFTIDHLLSYLSGYFTLQPGDIVLTGTPEGVGPINHGDTLSFRSSFSETVTIHFR
ncbi:MAG: fumarylacetoacetate hydrolase family protein [bacterium]|nr:fumarylacetoacetate hydrolase family protein [bacterium]